MSQIIKRNSGSGPSNPDLHVARFIVSAGGTTDGANYTTIAAAITAAVAAGGNQTIFIQPGVYTENLTLAPNIVLTGFTADADVPNVTISGKCTATFSGTCSMSGINFQTNGDYILEITGSNPTIVSYEDCFFTLTNANGFHCTSTGGNVRLFRCDGNAGTNTYFVFTAGGLRASYCELGSNNSTTASTFASSDCGFINCSIGVPIVTSGTGSFSALFSVFIVLNTFCAVINGTGSCFAYFCRFESGTQSAISVGSGATLPILNSAVYSTNTNAITGAGTIQYGEIDFYGAGASNTINTTTQTLLVSTMGQLKLANIPAYSVVIGNTTNGGILQSVSGVGTSGQVLTSNGPGAAPTFEDSTGLSQTVFATPLSSSVDMLTTGQTTIFTPSADFVVLSINAYADSVVDFAGNATVSLGTNSPDFNDLRETVIIPSATGFFSSDLINAVSFPTIFPVPSGTPIEINVLSAGSATTFTCKFFITGYYIV